MRRVLILFGALLLAVSVTAGVAAAATDMEKKQRAGWLCEDAAQLPEGHCVNPGAPQGGTFLILVFDEQGNKVAAETATFQPSADTRPCPNDPEDPDGDGTWWHPDGTPDGLYVCHHQSF